MNQNAAALLNTAEAAAAVPSRNYIEILAVAPAVVLLTALVFTVHIDPYIQDKHKSTLRIIIALVFSLIVQNYLEYRLAVSEPKVVASRRRMKRRKSI